MHLNAEKTIGIFSLIPLACSFAFGIMKEQSISEQLIKEFIPNTKKINHLTDDVYEVETNGKNVYVSFADHAGYAGPMHLAVAVDSDRKIHTVALLSSPDTKPYLDKILTNKMPHAYIGQDITELDAPDAVSGATMSSNAIIRGVEKAGYALTADETVRQNLNIAEANPKPEQKVYSGSIANLAVLFAVFIGALFLSAKNFRWNRKKAHMLLGAVSLASLGFLYGSQFSLATVSLFLSGAWLNGLANYAPLLAFVLALAVLLVTKKNLYCAHICPFGALQEGLSAITGCSAPAQQAPAKWISRFFALAVLCFSLYYANPSYASYEPFGKTFNMIGTFTLFALSITVIFASLIFRRPWCSMFCPVTPFFDYITFWRKLIFKKGS